MLGVNGKYQKKESLKFASVERTCMNCMHMESTGYNNSYVYNGCMDCITFGDLNNAFPHWIPVLSEIKFE